MNQMTHQEAVTILEALDNSINEVEGDVDSILIHERGKDKARAREILSRYNLAVKVNYLHKLRLLENWKTSELLRLIRTKTVLKDELLGMLKSFALNDPFPAANFHSRLNAYFLLYVESGLMIINQKLSSYENKAPDFNLQIKRH